MFMLRFFGPIREILDTLERVEVRNMSGVSWVLGDPQAKLLLTEIQAVHDRPSFWDEPYGLSVFGWNQLGLICSKYQLSDRLLEEKRNL